MFSVEIERLWKFLIGDSMKLKIVVKCFLEVKSSVKKWLWVV